MGNKRGGLVIKEKDQIQREKIEKVLGSCKELVMSSGGMKVPRMIIRGVDAIYENDRERVSELLAQNPEIGTLIKDENSVKIIAVKKGRNLGRESWIVEAPISVFRKIVTDGWVVMNLTRVRVDEDEDVVRCYKCCRFGHVAKFCQQEVSCYRCGGKHEGKECQSKRVNCVNCERVRLEKREHEANDWRCPVYIRQVERERSKKIYR